ncbi:MAG TPA: pyridoxal phosphate-dependent aminotransferase [Verrucomicrobiae bacterium]|nr:pyridoxal phosphate-dependent aminotransferase [Verrucomicrobiae bacterium]
MRYKQSEYMYWAKTNPRPKYNLATSGVGGFPLRDLPFDYSRLDIHGDNKYGFGPLKRAIAQQYGVDADCVVTSEGTSMANYLAMASLLDPGDDVLIEQPVYGLLVDAAQFTGATVTRFRRSVEDGCVIDPSAVRKAMTPRTKLIVVTNLHNPSSVLTDNGVLRELADIAASAGGHLLVDEVYLDAVYEDNPRSAVHLADNVVVTSSLTKIYGVSGLRCGWILARPDLARAMWRLNDLFAATPSHPGELLSVAAFEHLPLLRDRARRIVDADRAALNTFLDFESGVAGPRTKHGTTAFLKPVGRDCDHFIEALRSHYETSVVPGRFFEEPGYFRVGMGVDHEMFVEGLNRISRALASQA